MTSTIDLNADVGEDPTPDGLSRDEQIGEVVTSYNIACGGHAGTPDTMRRLVRFAKTHKIAIGAHPSYPDPQNFGRTEMTINDAALERSLTNQLQFLAAIAQQERASISHIKPHGALYHAACRPNIADLIARAARAVFPDATLVGQYASPALDHWRAANFRTASEAFADRAYEPDGSLRSRTLPGAVLHDAQLVATQALSIARDHRVTLADGSTLPIHADTLCLHADTPGSLNLARLIRAALENAKVRINPLDNP